ncbi:hypothetical protein R3P38DRAFT_3351153 [Favolaschia claudopus]|uniref:Uncharacterized protein n=1 Tax=Favolaschia claudopus TaxID=2862362 RepID=A0AAW0CF44_9AGAR
MYCEELTMKSFISRCVSYRCPRIDAGFERVVARAGVWLERLGGSSDSWLEQWLARGGVGSRRSWIERTVDRAGGGSSGSWLERELARAKVIYSVVIRYNIFYSKCGSSHRSSGSSESGVETPESRARLPGRQRSAWVRILGLRIDVRELFPNFW